MPKKKLIPDQHKAFKKAARALGADESEARFDAALKVVAKHKPSPESAKRTKRD
jgi:hypothetical protein